MHMDILMYKICGLVILHKWLCFVIVIFPESGLNYILLHNNKIYLKLIQKYNIAVFTVSSQQPPHHTTSSQRQVWFQLKTILEGKGEQILGFEVHPSINVQHSNILLYIEQTYAEVQATYFGVLLCRMGVFLSVCLFLQSAEQGRGPWFAWYVCQFLPYFKTKTLPGLWLLVLTCYLTPENSTMSRMNPQLCCTSLSITWIRFWKIGLSITSLGVCAV